MEVRAIGLVFVLWRDTETNQPVCQDAFCIHLGANLGAGGKIVDGCIECPFHQWKFGSDGTVKKIPYFSNPSQKLPTKKLKTYKCVDWCGLVCVYFHADDEEPAYQLPEFVPKELTDENWKDHLKWDAGPHEWNPVDLVDQAGDHTHFHTLHSQFLIPWTLTPVPKWIMRIIPIAIIHELRTFRGDDPEWKELVASTGWGLVDKHLIFFLDAAGLSWDGKLMSSTVSQTCEMYVGPALVVFKIPFTIGEMKVFLSFLPTEAGSIIRVRTWIDQRVQRSWWKKWIAWLLSGISASQLMADAAIINHKIRLSKPLIQPFDGPYNRTNAWLKQFYSSSSNQFGINGYKNDW